ncbi:MAG: deoxyribonuclease V [Methylococcaceae bacterium]|nr:deoxyribonuclease V [Methylococcaceae bacterium]
MALALRHPHRWDLTPTEAVALQRELAPLVVLHDDLPGIGRVAGVDCGFERNGTVTRAAVAVLSFPGLELVDQSVVRLPTSFPYVPGLLSFREIPAVLAALDTLRSLPDLIVVDGQGYAHPRRFGIACHLGVVTDIPTIGVGKTRLVGTFDPPASARGNWSPLHVNGDIVGAVVRSRANITPIFVSAGHRVSLATALNLVDRCTTRYRLPETTRFAHRLASG